MRTEIEQGESIMLDIKFVRENPDAVKENIKKKFQDAKLPLVDEVIAVEKLPRTEFRRCIILIQRVYMIKAHRGSIPQFFFWKNRRTCGIIS